MADHSNGVMGRYVIFKLVTIFKLPLAHVTRKLFLFVAAVDTLMPLQAVLPFVFLAAVGAHVLGLQNSDVGVATVELGNGVAGASWLRSLQRFHHRYEALVFLAYTTGLPLQHPQGVVLLHVFRFTN